VSARRQGHSDAPRAILSWSSGKDSAHALHRVRQEGTYNVVALLTTVVAGSGRVATHGIRGELLRRQVESVGLPLLRVALPRSPSNVVYERGMAAGLRPFAAQGVRHVIFGDLFLGDIRKYRERQLGELGMECVFPLWGLETGGLAREMLDSGLRARLVSVDILRLPATWAGRPFDTHMLEELPSGIDPCGENGEFHTFVTAGPVLRRAVPVKVQSIRTRDGFATADLRPASAAR
jgi:uncharacterized protein (TIGR00290 family)